MQTGVPSLPIVCSDKHSCSSSKYSDSVDGTPRKKSFAGTTRLLKRKSFNDMYVNSPYRSSARFHPVSQPGRSKNPVGQRVLSAKMLRLKQLQNQLTDAHYHLNELSNENKLLKAIQKKQESALKKYEGSNAELPRIINSHHEELRILQMKYKKIKEQHKNTCDNLKEKEKELHSLQVFNKKLLQLSQDRNLLERDKLQSQVQDLNYQIQQLQDTIQTLNKKLALETKSLKQQIHTEVVKHKETQKNLQETVEKLKSLEDLLDNRERRLYYNNQLPMFKNKSLGNYSLSSFEDSGVSLNFSKSSMKKVESDTDKILPTLSDLDINFERKLSSRNDGHFTEKKFRFQKSGSRSISAKSLDRLDKSLNSNVIKKQKEDEPLTFSSQESNKIDKEEEEDKTKKNILDELENSDITELSDVNEKTNLHENLPENLFRKSREICARLTSDQSMDLIGTPPLNQNNYDEIEKIVKQEFKLGQDLATNIFHDFHTTIEINDEDEANIKTEVSDLTVIPPTNISPVEDIQNIENNAGDLLEESKLFFDEKTFCQSSDLDNSFEKLNLKDKNGYENVEKVESKEEKEKIDIYLNGNLEEEKSRTRSNSLEKVNPEIRRNSVDKKESEKKDEKLSKKVKDKLLADMKAIDNNDNIEYYDQKSRRNSGSNVRSQITENLYRGIPTQRRGDAIASMFMNVKLDAKIRGNGLNKFY